MVCDTDNNLYEEMNGDDDSFDNLCKEMNEDDDSFDSFNNYESLEYNTEENSFWQEIMELKSIYKIILIVFILILLTVILYLIIKFKGKVDEKIESDFNVSNFEEIKIDSSDDEETIYRKKQKKKIKEYLNNNNIENTKIDLIKILIEQNKEIKKSLKRNDFDLIIFTYLLDSQNTEDKVKDKLNHNKLIEVNRDKLIKLSHNKLMVSSNEVIKLSDELIIQQEFNTIEKNIKEIKNQCTCNKELEEICVCKKKLKEQLKKEFVRIIAEQNRWIEILLDNTIYTLDYCKFKKLVDELKLCWNVYKNNNINIITLSNKLSSSCNNFIHTRQYCIKSDCTSTVCILELKIDVVNSKHTLSIKDSKNFNNNNNNVVKL